MLCVDTTVVCQPIDGVLEGDGLLSFQLQPVIEAERKLRPHRERMLPELLVVQARRKRLSHHISQCGGRLRKGVLVLSADSGDPTFGFLRAACRARSARGC